MKNTRGSIFVLFLQITAVIFALFSILANFNQEVLAKPKSADLIEDVSDNGQSQHPSGKERNTEHGKSQTQGKSESNPDGNGADKRRDAKDGSDAGTQGISDYDDNNGCGNDHDFADDNNGNCGGRSESNPSPSPKPKPKAKSTPTPSPSPSPNPSPIQTGGSNPSPSPTPNPSPTPTPQVLGRTISQLPETGVDLVKYAWFLLSLPLGLYLSKYKNEAS